jgi:mRNA-degrading endonuclease RelE of RelBE toxin-antitoxin system
MKIELKHQAIKDLRSFQKQDAARVLEKFSQLEHLAEF